MPFHPSILSSLLLPLQSFFLLLSLLLRFGSFCISRLLLPWLGALLKSDCHLIVRGRGLVGRRWLARLSERGWLEQLVCRPGLVESPSAIGLVGIPFGLELRKLCLSTLYFGDNLELAKVFV